MRTFKELADAALGQEPTHMVVKELAQAMERLEYNLALQISHLGMTRGDPYSRELAEAITKIWLDWLRTDLP